MNKYTFLAIALLTPTAAFAEVSDKVAPISVIWAIGIVAGVICFTICYLVKWYGLIVAALPLSWFVLVLIGLHTDDVGKALYHEQGAAYFIQSYLAAFLVLIGVIAGIFCHKKFFYKNLKKIP
ncbi:MAG: hypothetical protein LBV29_06875 [Azoarcus sp.]|nr:hypothetical protein [Azoarcus sp.]